MFRHNGMGMGWVWDRNGSKAGVKLELEVTGK